MGHAKPKHGKGSNGIFAVVWLPLTFTANILVWPIHTILWFLINLVGDSIKRQKLLDKHPELAYAIPQPWFFTHWVMRHDWIKKRIKYLKKARYVLCDYFSWPRSHGSKWKCKRCPNRGMYWCMHCGKRYCAQCSHIFHAPGTTNALLHTVEEITDRWHTDGQGVQVLSPVLPEFMAMTIFLRLCSTSTIVSDIYLSKQVMCPAVNEVKGLVATFDTVLFYHFKNLFATWCDIEDSFMRFVMDTWVHSVVADTDNVIMVLQTLPHALMYNIVLVYVVVPIISIVYAVLLNGVYQVERLLPHTPFLLQMEDLAHSCNITQKFGIFDPTEVPPETKPRQKRSFDPIDDLLYKYHRVMRHMSYYYQTSLAGMQSLCWGLIACVVVVRLACIFLGLGPLLRTVLSWIGWGSTIKLHREWFADIGENFIEHDTIIRVISFVGNLIKYIFDKVPVVGPLLSSLRMWCCLWVIIIAMVCITVHWVVKKRDEWFQDWLSGGEERSVDFGQDKVLKPR